MAQYADAMSFGGHLAAVMAEPDGHIAVSLVLPDAYPSADEARRLAASLIVAADMADQPPESRDQRPETD